MKVGDRVTHVDPTGKALPMAGTVVGVNVRYLVEWDGAEPGVISGWTPTFYYPSEVLRPLDGEGAGTAAPGTQGTGALDVCFATDAGRHQVTSEPDVRRALQIAQSSLHRACLELGSTEGYREDFQEIANALKAGATPKDASPVVSVAQLREWIEEERARNGGMYRDTVRGDAYASGDAHAIGRLSAWLDDLEGGTRT